MGNSNTGDQQNDWDKPPSWRRIIADFVQAYGDAQRAKNDQQPSSDRAANWTAWATVAIAAFTFATIGVGIAQWNIQSRTLNEIQAEQRPWIRLSNISVVQRVAEENGQYAIPLNVSITNGGKLPAFHVTFTTEAVVGIDRLVNIPNKKCDAKRKEPFSDSEGSTIFPGEIASITAMSGDEWPRVNIDDWNRSNRFIVIVGCVDYQVLPLSDHHQTRFAYIVGVPLKDKFGETNSNAIGVLPPDLANANVILQRTYYGVNRPAD